MYLLLYMDLNKQEREWLMKNALPVAPLVWVYNSEIKGTLRLKLNHESLEELKETINLSSLASIATIEEQIKKNSLRGRSKGLAVNKLRLIVDCSLDLDIISHAKDLLKILDGIEHKSKPNPVEKEENLGIDTQTVREYLARLAKDPSIH
jgi:predicted transcriptional regulator